MSDQPLQVLAVVGSLNPTSVTRTVILHAVERLRGDGSADCTGRAGSDGVIEVAQLVDGGF